ncbi:MAG: DPP IV N-terminal domain-containing protein, partial [Verrucomicrobiota bacterium]
MIAPSCCWPEGRPLGALAAWISLAAALVVSRPVLAQGSKADYDRAQSLAQRTENKVFRARVRPEWFNPSNFWYRVETGPGLVEFVRVNATTGGRQPLMDLRRLRAAVGQATGTAPPDAGAMPESIQVDADGAHARLRLAGKRWRLRLADHALVPNEQPEAPLPAAQGRVPRRSRRTGDETSITFVNQTRDDAEVFWLDADGERRSYGRLRPGQERSQHTYEGHAWLVTDKLGNTLAVFEADATGRRAVIEEGRPAPPAVQAQKADAPTLTPPARVAPKNSTERGQSPDGQWVAFVQDHNLHLRPANGGPAVALSRDGNGTNAYSPDVSWAPDSSAVVARRVRKGGERLVHMVEAAPKGQVQPRLHEQRYLKPGDDLPKPVLRVFTVSDQRQWNVADALYPNPFTESGDIDVRWSPDGREFYFDYNQRGHQAYRILGVKLPSPGTASGGAAGEPPHEIEPRAVVDEASRTFIDWTNKTWREWLPGTGELLWMSERDGWCHLWLYDVATGRPKNPVTRGEWVVRRVEHVDAAARQAWFLASGVRPGQDPYFLHLCRVNFDGTGMVVLTEADGTHTVQFSPGRTWFLDTWSRVDQAPVTELRRASDGGRVATLERGDASAWVAAGWTTPEPFVAPGRDGSTPIHGILIKPSNFDPSRRYPVVEEIYAGPQGAFVPKEFGRLTRQHAIAELGFVVVQIDGMGTNHRSKAFHDVCWKNLGDSGFPDRIAWLRAAARTRPWMDLSRVGIYGGSAGGQSAARALIAHGDFYRVAVSDCGCHDNRVDKIW